MSDQHQHVSTSFKSRSKAWWHLRSNGLLLFIFILLLMLGSIDGIFELKVLKDAGCNLNENTFFQLLQLLGDVILILAGSVGGLLISNYFGLQQKDIQDAFANTINEIHAGLLTSPGDSLSHFKGKTLHAYHTTVTLNNPHGAWGYTQLNFIESPKNALQAMFDFRLGPNSNKALHYKTEAVFRGNHLVMITRESQGNERPSTWIFPDAGTNYYDIMAGIGIGQPFTGPDMVRATLLSSNPLISGINNGIIPDEHWNLLDEKWKDNFKLPMYFQPYSFVETTPFTGHYFSIALRNDSIVDFALVHIDNSGGPENISVFGRILDTSGVYSSKQFKSTHSKLDVDSRTITFNYSSELKTPSIGIAKFIFNNYAQKVNGYKGAFIDDSSESGKAIVRAIRIEQQAYEKIKQSIQSGETINFAEFDDIQRLINICNQS